MTVSLHGRAIGFDRNKCGFVTPRISKGLIKQFTITSAELLALNATPISILAAPGTGLVTVPRSLHLYKQAGTAYAGIAAGEDFTIKQTDASGAVLMTVEMTGFLDSTAVQRAFGVGATGTIVTNAALVAHMATGEVTTGTGALFGWLEYDVYPFALDLRNLQG
jgi:hypothetical protein